MPKDKTSSSANPLVAYPRSQEEAYLHDDFDLKLSYDQFEFLMAEVEKIRVYTVPVHLVREVHELAIGMLEMWNKRHKKWNTETSKDKETSTITVTL